MKKISLPYKFRTQGKTVLMAHIALAMLCTVLVFGCQTSLEPIRTANPTPAPASADVASAKPEVTATAQAVQDSSQPASIYLDLTLSGEYVHGFPVKDDPSKKVVMDAVFNYMIKSAAWPGVDISTLKDSIAITIQYSEKDAENSVFYVFEKDGKHCMQTGKDGMYSTISDQVYEPLKDLAMGYSLPYAMTIVSGGNTIHAAEHTIGSTQKKDGLCADMLHHKPQQMADHIQYLKLDPGRKTLEPFTPFVYGKEVYGAYTLYDDKFEEVQFIHPSGLVPQTYLFKDAKPGKYIVELQTSYENDVETFESQYFFGVIVP